MLGEERGEGEALIGPLAQSRTVLSDRNETHSRGRDGLGRRPVVGSAERLEAGDIAWLEDPNALRSTVREVDFLLQEALDHGEDVCSWIFFDIEKLTFAQASLTRRGPAVTGRTRISRLDSVPPHGARFRLRTSDFLAVSVLHHGDTLAKRAINSLS